MLTGNHEEFTMIARDRDIDLALPTAGPLPRSKSLPPQAISHSGNFL